MPDEVIGERLSFFHDAIDRAPPQVHEAGHRGKVRIKALKQQMLGQNVVEQNFLLLGYSPRGVSRAPIPKEVPPGIVSDYSEACLVLDDSPKASAALSRRCLQSVLRQAAKVKPGDLSNEIQEVLDSGKLPDGLAQNIDAVRHIGNFAAHPNKSKSTGEVMEVEPHEAEWNLEVLEGLFDHYYVQPTRAKARRDALNAKLGDMNKPPLKQP